MNRRFKEILPEIQISYESLHTNTLGVDFGARICHKDLRQIFLKARAEGLFLETITAVDYPKEGKLEVLYFLGNYYKLERILLSIDVSRDDPVIDSVSDIFRGALWHERETSEFFGIKFKNIPDPRPLFLTDDLNGFPLRKDFEPGKLDPIGKSEPFIYEPSSEEKGVFVLNLGPQHPATHGVLRIILHMDGEYVLEADPILGYGHRMQEKIAEGMTYGQVLPYTARMDYLSALHYNHAWVIAVERLCGIEVPERAEYIRVITSELNRISSHLLWFGAFLLDLGAFTPFLHGFADREYILDLLEMVTGSRLTYCYFRFGGVLNDVDSVFLEKTMEFVAHLRGRLPAYHDLVTGNVIFEKRTKGVGVIDRDTAACYGVTGPCLRGSGVSFDIRRAFPYSIYSRFDFDIPVGESGDCYSRYLVRMQEIEESLKIIEQAVKSIPKGEIRAKVPKIIRPPEGMVAASVESSRGNLCIILISTGDKKPYRTKYRVPSFSNLSIFPRLARKELIADCLAILGSFDLVVPEIDR